MLAAIAVISGFALYSYFSKEKTATSSARAVIEEAPVSTPLSTPLSSPATEAPSIALEKTESKTPASAPLVYPDAMAGWLVYEFEGFDYYETIGGFQLIYPESWNLAVDRNDETFFLSLKLEKAGTTLVIEQREAGDGNCLFPEDPIEDSMASRYGDYVRLWPTSGLEWRRAMAEEDSRAGRIRHTICEAQQSPQIYNPITRIGWIQIEQTQADAASIAEIDQILQKIEFK